MKGPDTLVGAGCNASVPPNGFIGRPERIVNNGNPGGLSSSDMEIDLKTIAEDMKPVSGDRACATWVRSYNGFCVPGLREHLRDNNGIKGLELVSPGNTKRAAELFHRDGFVAIKYALDPDQLKRMRAATHKAVAELMEDDPGCSAGRSAGSASHRYSPGEGSALRHMLHKDEWCELIDLPTTAPVLAEIFGSSGYVVGGAGGDVVMPGAIEYQSLHSDNIWTELPDPHGGVTMRDLPVPALTISFPMTDLTFENGPVRQIPGTQRSRAPIPDLRDEPDWMKLSTVCPAPAGTAILSDIRTWQGGTPNLSGDIRVMPNVEYHAPWFRSEGIKRCMPYEQWEKLSAHAQRISRFVVCDRDERFVDTNCTGPRRGKHDAFRQKQLEEKGASAYLARL